MKINHKDFIMYMYVSFKSKTSTITVNKFCPNFIFVSPAKNSGT